MTKLFYVLGIVLGVLAVAIGMNIGFIPSSILTVVAVVAIKLYYTHYNSGESQGSMFYIGLIVFALGGLFIGGIISIFT